MYLNYVSPAAIETYIDNLGADDITDNGFAYWLERLLFSQGSRGTLLGVATHLDEAASVLEAALELIGAFNSGPCGVI
jgi:glucuronate isomerase